MIAFRTIHVPLWRRLLGALAAVLQRGPHGSL